jgi:hypothetical protein
MTDNILNFEWQVPDDGFEWVVAEVMGERYSRGGFVWPSGFRNREGRIDQGEEELFLLPVNAQRADVSEQETGAYKALGLAELTSYRPFDRNPALFREFAELPDSFLDIRNFSNKWGSLGSDAAYSIVLGKYDSTRWGEASGRWSDEILEMRTAVQIWDMARLHDQEALKKLISFEDDGVMWRYITDGGAVDEKVEYLCEIENEEAFKQLCDKVIHGTDQNVFISPGINFAGQIVSDEKYHPERMAVISQDDLTTAALFVVEDFINDGLKGRVSAQMGWSHAHRRPMTQLIPDSLLGAMWLQFSMAVSRNIDFGHCLECRSWFEISPGTGRPDKSYCSDACRMRAYRERKKAKIQRLP